MLARWAWPVVGAGLALGCGSSPEPDRAAAREGSTTTLRAESQPAGQGTATAGAEAAAAAGRVAGLPEGWELVPSAKYTATQAAGEVTIKANGENPTTGYETKLVQGMLRIWPPQYLLGRKRPDGPAGHIVTRFEVTASFKANEPVKAVRVTDGAGRHEVKVEPAAK